MRKTKLNTRKKIQWIIAIVVILCSCYPIESKGQESALLDSAEMAYNNGNYKKCIALYDSIINSGKESVEIYYNLGNAYYKSNKIPLAILNFERAKLLSPNDPDVLFNLDLANKHVVDKLEILPKLLITSWINDFVTSFSADYWAVFSISTFILFLVLLSVFFYLRMLIVRKIAFWLSVICCLLSIVTFILSSNQNKILTVRDGAIVSAPSVTIKSSPADGGTDLFLLHEGIKVFVSDKVGEWSEIRLSDGNEGWMRTSDLMVI